MTVFSHLRPQRDLRKLKKHGDYKYYVFEHSGHGLQNDNAMSKKWMVSIEEYLNKYMPIEQ